MLTVTQSAPFLDLTFDEWRTAVAPKVNGCWNLHNVLSDQPLEFFLLASSLLSATDYPGQANTSAADTFQEAFCQHRQSLGLPASVLNICPIDGVGRLEADPDAKKELKAQDFFFLGEREFLDFIESSILNSRSAPVTISRGSCSSWKNPNQLFMGLRSEKALDNPDNGLSWRRDRRMAIYHNVKAFGSANGTTESSELKELLSSANSDPELLSDNASADVLAHGIGKKILEYRLQPDEEVDTSLTPVQMGMDSLKAIELRRWWKQMFGVNIDVLDIMASRPLEQLGKLAADRIRKKLKGEEEDDGEAEE